MVNTMATNSEPNDFVNFVQSTNIGTHENKAINSIFWCAYNNIDLSNLSLVIA